ncbi:hypothetical protein AHAS_Ahas05G0150600 [Arachis hypogaea]
MVSEQFVPVEPEGLTDYATVHSLCEPDGASWTQSQVRQSPGKHSCGYAGDSRGARGTSKPTEADNWLQATERALQAQQVLLRILLNESVSNMREACRIVILSSVAPMEIRVFSEHVNKSRVAEECVRKVAVENGSQLIPFQRA